MTKTILISIAVVAILVVSFLMWNRESRAKRALKGQRNAHLTFQGLVVDQDGKPLAGVKIKGQVERFPDDWTFDTRGEGSSTTPVSARSGPDGRFRLELMGHKLRVEQVELAGYRHFYDMSRGDSSPVDNHFFQLIAWGDLWYKPDIDRPAVYVMVRDGMREVTALPCKGGSKSPNGTYWIQNNPGWPKRPSLTDVVQKRAATAPS